ncbi:MAG: hypothetical protein IAF02_25770 [Anaerolineae bacterium]|nr:hypothetical protein [Anaerolineae bacterium]
MNELNSFSWQMSTMHTQRKTGSWENRDHNIVLAAVRLYERVCWQGHLARLTAWLRRRPFQLFDLETVKQQCQISNQHHAGTLSVPVKQIRGSDDRCHDFDYGFHPRQSHSRQKWLSVAMTHLAGDPLPPVDLVQVSGVYFVRDGHHRISVARALGQQEIEAVVTVWQVTGSLPWEPATIENGMGWGASVT